MRSGGRYSACVTTSNRFLSATHPLASTARRTVRASAVLGPVVAALIAAPAVADVPVGWSDPAPVSVLDFLWVFVGAPALLFLIIGFIAYVPALIKGEKLSGGPMPTAAPSFQVGSSDTHAELTSAE